MDVKKKKYCYKCILNEHIGKTKRGSRIFFTVFKIVIDE